MSDQYLVLRPVAGPLSNEVAPKALPPELLRGLGYTLAVDYWPPDRPFPAMTEHHFPCMRELANKPCHSVCILRTPFYSLTKNGINMNCCLIVPLFSRCQVVLYPIS